MKMNELKSIVFLPNATDLENAMNNVIRISEAYNLSPDSVTDFKGPHKSLRYKYKIHSASLNTSIHCS